MKLFKTMLIAASLIGSLAIAPAGLTQQTTPATNTATAQQTTVSSVGKVNINTADAAVLAERLNGIGEKKAQAIVEHREKNGPFKSVDDLKSVSGIGEATLEKNRGVVSVD